MTDVDVPEIDDTLARLVEVIDTLSPPPSEGPGVILTLSGLVISGRVIAPRQWFEEVEHASRAGFTVHTGGAIDDEHGGWATLFTTVSESLTRDHDEHAAAQDAFGSLPERYQQRLLPLTRHISSTFATPASSPPAAPACPLAGCTGGDGSPRSRDGPSVCSTQPRRPPRSTTPATTGRSRRPR